MSSKPSLKKIKKDLEKLKKYETIIYGSYASNNLTPRSDIDIGIITREKDEKKNRKIWHNILGQAPEKYDIRVFELMPLNIKISIINNFKVVWGDRKEISEYFYHFRKLWKETKFRYKENQFKSWKEKLEILRKRKS